MTDQEPMIRLHEDLTLDSLNRTFSLLPVKLDSEVEQLRVIRNECRATMTEMTGEISEEAQARWWRDVKRSDTLRAYLARDENDEVVGFGVRSRRKIPVPTDSVGTPEYLRAQVYGWWVTVGVRPQFRRQGFGAKIFEALAMIGAGGGDRVYALIRNDNEPSLRAARAAGYVRLLRMETTSVLFCGDDW